MGMTLPPPVDRDRRRISALAALALLGGPAITIVGCGGGGGSSPAAAPPPPTATPTPPPAASCPAGNACGQVSVDPQHHAEITSAQLSAGGALTLDIRGSSTHSHTVALTGDEVVAIRNAQRVEKVSTTTLSHDHLVTFN
jgi:hypothetical protein